MHPHISIRESVRLYVRPYVHMSVTHYIWFLKKHVYTPCKGRVCVCVYAWRGRIYCLSTKLVLRSSEMLFLSASPLALRLLEAALDLKFGTLRSSWFWACPLRLYSELWWLLSRFLIIIGALLYTQSCISNRHCCSYRSSNLSKPSFFILGSVWAEK